MYISELMEKLENVKKVSADLENQIQNSYVKVQYNKEYCVWKVEVFLSTESLISPSYWCEFDTIDELYTHLSAMLIGAMLTNGKEV